MSYQIVSCDILDIDTKYIAHQCNCLTIRSDGLAKSIFDKFPYSNIYEQRKDLSRGQMDNPGNIVISGDGKENRFVINMLAQYYPGYVKYPDSRKDGYIARQSYFNNCLNQILEIKDLESIAFPYKIGCGMAGGDWKIYEKLIDNFSFKTDAKVYICKKD